MGTCGTCGIWSETGATPASSQRAYAGSLKALKAVGPPRTEVLLAATSRAAAIGCAGVTGVLAPVSRATSSPRPATPART